MKNKKFLGILILEAISCLLFYSLQANFPNLFSAVIAFPFEQIGFGLRKLSLSGSMGNVFAIIIYVIVCLLPVGCFCWLKKKKKKRKIDWLLPALSILLFVVIYYMINPGLFGETVSGMGKMLLGTTFYSVFIGYLTLRILEKCVSADKKWLQKGLRILLHMVIILLVYVVFGECFGSLPSTIQNLREANSISSDGLGFFFGEIDLTATYIFLVLQSIVNAIPYLLDIAILFLMIRMMDEMEKDQYSDITVEISGILSKLCIKALVITVSSNMGLNVLQLIFHESLYQINVVVSLPIVSIVLVLAVLLMARYIRENQKLKQNYDLFI